jgi:hypothetical protein
MRSSLKPIAVGASVAAIAASLMVGPAAASPALPTLVLSMKNKEALLGDSVTLGCDEEEAAGTHPRRELACDALEQAGGDFAKLPVVTGVNCPMIYDPVVARAVGRWHGKKVNFEAEYANGCVAAAESSEVFRW